MVFKHKMLPISRSLCVKLNISWDMYSLLSLSLVEEIETVKSIIAWYEYALKTIFLFWNWRRPSLFVLKVSCLQMPQGLSFRIGQLWVYDMWFTRSWGNKVTMSCQLPKLEVVNIFGHVNQVSSDSANVMHLTFSMHILGLLQCQHARQVEYMAYTKDTV